MRRHHIAHDLAVVYLNNKYGVDVTGQFSVDSSISSESDTVREVRGQGEVETRRLPDLHDPELVRIGTGTRHLFGIGPEKKRWEPTGRYAVDPIFRSMISDYFTAYDRLLGMIDTEFGDRPEQ